MLAERFRLLCVSDLAVGGCLLFVCAHIQKENPVRLRARCNDFCCLIFFARIRAGELKKNMDAIVVNKFRKELNEYIKLNEGNGGADGHKEYNAQSNFLRTCAEIYEKYCDRLHLLEQQKERNEKLLVFYRRSILEVEKKKFMSEKLKKKALAGLRSHYNPRLLQSQIKTINYILK